MAGACLEDEFWMAGLFLVDDPGKNSVSARSQHIKETVGRTGNPGVSHSHRKSMGKQGRWLLTAKVSRKVCGYLPR